MANVFTPYIEITTKEQAYDWLAQRLGMITLSHEPEGMIKDDKLVKEGPPVWKIEHHTLRYEVIGLTNLLRVVEDANKLEWEVINEVDPEDEAPRPWETKDAEVERKKPPKGRKRPVKKKKELSG